MLHPLQITIKNYRCFEDAEPARFTLKPGFSAFVGPNNSGKSTILRLFYELRQLWQLLGAPASIASSIPSIPQAVQLQGVDDIAEIFCNINDRELTLEIELTDPPLSDMEVRKLIVRSRNRRNLFEIEAYTTTNQRLDSKKGETLKVAGAIADITRMTESCRSLGNSFYVGPFRHALSEGGGKHFDTEIGKSFITSWHDWKTGPTRQRNRQAQEVARQIASLFGFKQLEINVAADGATLQVIVDGYPYRLRELGGGLAEFIVVIANVAIAQPSVLLVDEPELHLHPPLQAGFLSTLASHATDAVLFATHSLGLARSSAEQVFSLTMRKRRSRVSTFAQTPNYAEFAGEMSFSAFQELGHDLLLLVEGTTEVKAVQQFLRTLGHDAEVVVIPLGGAAMIRGGVQVELAELRRLTSKVAVLIDSERQSADAPLETSREAFVSDCRALGFLVHVTDRRAFENYLSQDAIRAVKGLKYRALGPYECLNDLEFPWAKHENWRIASRMSKGELTGTDLGAFLDSLV